MATLRIATFALVCLLFSASGIYGLQVTPNSPCKSKCATGNAQTTEKSIVCLDSDFSTGTGSQFQQCVECELGSTAADPKTGTTDVMWGLCKSCMPQFSAVSFLTRSRQHAIYTLFLHVRFPDPEGLPEQPMPGNMRTSFQCDRKWTWDEHHGSRLGILQYGEFHKLQHPTMRILLWTDG